MKNKKMKRMLALAMSMTLAVSTCTTSALASTATGAEEVSTTALTYDSKGYVIYDGVIGSWSSGGTEDYQYVAALIIKDSVIDTTYSNTKLLKSKGSYTNSVAVGIEINDSISGHNGIIIIDSNYTISGATITMETTADGTDTCDFSGKGSAIAVFGNSNVVIENSTITTKGVATMPIFVDSGATATIISSTLTSNGGTLYGDYMNTPDQALMVAPPWILGIMGTSRCTNLMGNNSTMNVVDSTTSAGAWAVLSTDSGQNMYLNMYNTSLTLNNVNEGTSALLQQTTRTDGTASQLYQTVDNPDTTTYGSGYGTYVIGNAVEVFAGATVNVGTYACIFTGGSATFTSITKGQQYTLKSATGNTDYTYTATATKVSTVNSDTFGFMFHQSANYLTIEAGTVINSGYATFLVKSGSSNESATVTVDNATINNGGVLIQVMDNDDATNGGMMATDDEQNYNGTGMNFRTQHTENAGFSTASAVSASEQNFTFTNGTYEGNIYNSSGSDQSTMGTLDASTLNVTLGKGATLSGAAASTAAVHVTYAGSVAIKAQGGYAYEGTAADVFAATYQNTSYDATEYFYQGQVANKINYNGGNDINITLTYDSVWNVTGTSVISSLSISDSAKVVIPANVTLTVNGVEYTNTTLTASTVFKGNVVTESGLQYTVTKVATSSAAGTVSVTGYTTAAKSVTIPATITIGGSSYKVTAIAKKAFKGNTTLKSITIGKNVTKIGSKAFAGATKLSTITVEGSSLKSVGSKALKNVKSVTVSASTKSIAKLFKGKGAKSITIK